MCEIELWEQSFINKVYWKKLHLNIGDKRIQHLIIFFYKVIQAKFLSWSD